MGSRRQARELILQALYLNDTGAVPLETAFGMVSAGALPDTIRQFSQRLIEGMIKEKNAIDEILSRYTENWDLKRMAAVDRNILRLATLEILTETDTPISVIIDEAIEIAKSYSTEDSGKFVNGILDKVQHERRAQ